MTTPLVELSKCRSAVRKKAFSKNEKSSASPNPAGGNRRILANSLVQALIRYLRKNRTFVKRNRSSSSLKPAPYIMALRKDFWLRLLLACVLCAGLIAAIVLLLTFH
jgi:hypothetical protein